jgi:hypothetical protein
MEKEKEIRRDIEGVKYNEKEKERKRKERMTEREQKRKSLSEW